MSLDRDIQIEASIEFYRERFRLGDWEVRYTPDQTELDDDEPEAQIEYERHRKRATVRVREDVDGDRIPRVIAHEMFHLVLLDIYDLVFHVMSKHGDTALGVMDMLDELKERLCETVAEAITGIPWTPADEYGIRKHAPFVDHSRTGKEAA